MTHLETLHKPVESFAITGPQAAPLARVDHAERTSSPLNLEVLQTFEKTEIPVGPEFGERLEATCAHITLFVRPDEQDAGDTYRRIIGQTGDKASLVVCEDPILLAQEETALDVIPLVINSAIDPQLKEMMFRNPDFGQLLADSFPVPSSSRPVATPILYTIGITRHGIVVLDQSDATAQTTTSVAYREKKRSARIKAVVGDIITPADFHDILHSQQVKYVIIHALGPAGTNISQASHLYAERIGITGKTEVTIHGVGITPLDYAQIAADETRASLSSGTLPETLHLHVECAVYNDMDRLYEERAEEAIFIDEQNMALDTMQLAAVVSMEELQNMVKSRGRIRIATHPSPRSLVLQWIERGLVEWIQASSNSAAALMVAKGQADMCVTTASSVGLLTKHGREIHTLYEFGSPNMIFTIASSMTHKQLQRYLDAEGRAI